ncbi:MAG: hypothetical protein QGG40_16350 [Myxococcota bacterium]|nr:hypothetical protein [Myxococcota bacterium]
MEVFSDGEPGSTWAITLAWHGRDFVGWQRQPSQRSIQKVVEESLAQLHGGTPVAVMASGRTDSGVHAEAQVCSFRTPRCWDPVRLFKSLNGVLPEDIACLEARVVPDGFCARRWSHRKY